LRSQVRNGCSRTFKVVDFGTDQKRAYDLLLVMHSNPGSVSRLLVENRQFFLPLSHSVPSIRVTPLKFLANLYSL